MSTEPTLAARSITGFEPSGRQIACLVAALLALHWALAVSSLVLENPTVDEVVHLPAGVSYWQTGTFKLYRHNPPLIKLVAALPVLASGPATGMLYQMDKSWRAEYPSQAMFAQVFMGLNAGRYFELFRSARLLMPIFSVLGGLVVFLWSRQLHGPMGGLLSLSLWCLCPNILAHARLVTTDVGAAALGVGATFLFWRYLQRPTWRRAVFSGLVLGLAQLAKFSNLLLFGIWPLLWLVYELSRGTHEGRARRIARSILQGAVLVAVCVLTIDLGYGFEGVGTPLGDFDFASRSFLTRPGVTSRANHPDRLSGNELIDISWRHRVNRFRGTWLDRFPSPLPRHYLLGFDEQKIEADGVPLIWLNPNYPDSDEVTGYPVYLDGVLRRHGWWYYYLLTLVYKVPEGTWFLVLLSIGVLAISRRSRAAWTDAFCVWAVPLAVLGAMSFLTDINLGLRYVLAMFPYVFIATGKLAPWVIGLKGRVRTLAMALVVGSLLATATATFLIHPHYLAYFNWASGGPSRGSEHLIDSNLDWGQDLLPLREWLRDHPQEEPIGLAYFGQIPPNLFAARGDGFDWFLPPILPGRYASLIRSPGAGPIPRLKPGLYAISASLLRGLPWRIYDPETLAWVSPAWNAKEHAFSYFRELTPLPESLGYSILLYRVTAADAKRLNAKYWP